MGQFLSICGEKPHPLLQELNKGEPITLSSRSIFHSEFTLVFQTRPSPRTPVPLARGHMASVSTCAPGRASPGRPANPFPAQPATPCHLSTDFTPFPRPPKGLQKRGEGGVLWGGLGSPIAWTARSAFLTAGTEVRDPPRAPPGAVPDDGGQ